MKRKLTKLVWLVRSWRYHQAIRKSLRHNERRLARARRQTHTHNLVVFGADSGTLVARCTICGQTEEGTS